MLHFFAFSSLRRWSAAVLLLLTLLLAGRAARAQAPTLMGLSPTRNARSAAVTASPAFTFSQPMSSGAATLGAVKVFSSQRGGRLQSGAGGSTTASGNTLTFDPTTDFKPGETVFSTVTTAAQSSGGTALTTGRVQQFTAATGGTGRGGFLPGSDAAVGTNPYAVAVGDVDNDGDLDLLVTNLVGRVSVRLNGGNNLGGGTGTFSNGGSVNVGNRPFSVVLADVDGDGDLDLLTANNNSAGTVSVRLNGGNNLGGGTGTFTGGAEVAVGSSPHAVALGDVDGDGDLDLLAANGGTTGTVSVRLNGGDNTGSNTGTFAGGSEVAVGNQPRGVALGDVDGDGDLDLLVTNSRGNTVSVRLNGGNDLGSNTGAFSGGSEVAVGNAPFGVALGDVDNDGDLDLLTANANSPGTVSVRLNGGDNTGSNTGSFSNGSDPAVGSSPFGVAVGDVDNDGDLDLLAANFGGGTVSVRLNGGDATSSNPGAFSNGTDPAVGSSPFGVALGDVDGDGDLDLLAANSTNAGTVSVRLNQPPPVPAITSFAPASGPVGTVVTVTGTNLAGATAASVNGTAGTGLTANTATGLTFTVGAGSSTGVVSVTTPGGTASSSGSFTVVPLLTLTGLSPTRNQRSAAATASPAFTFDQAMSNGATTLGAVKVFSSQRGGRMQDGARGATTASGNTLTFNPTTDFKPGETVFTTVTTAAQSSAGVALARGRVQQFTTAVGGTGRGNFRPGTDPAVSSQPYALAVADVDGDGDLDLLTANGGTTSTVSVRLNGGDNTGTNTGVFGGGSTVAVGNFPQSLAVGDVDGDGDLDFVTASTDAAGTVSVRLNGGDATGSSTGVFAAGSTVGVGSGPLGVVLGDVDGDGDLDLLTANLVAGTVSVRLNGGDATGTNTGIFGNGSDLALGNRPYVVAVSDVDGDGDLDLLVTKNNAAGTVSVRLNGGDATGSNTGVFSDGSDPTVDSSPRGVALADVDGDGDLDLLTTNITNNTVSVRLNGGDATGSNTSSFSNGADLAVGNFPFNVALGDVDGDGDLDFVTANLIAGTVSVRFNQPAAPLPVELVAFTATAQGSAVQLAWRTASEKNSLRFDIERSADGQQFGRIGEVAAQGTKTTPTAYAYLDPNPIPHIAYYRLRQVDLDGTFAYSPVRAVKLTSSPPQHLTAFPNPARAAVAVGGAPAGAEVAVFDALGRTVATATADAAGTARLALPVGLAAGVYVVRCGGQAQRLAVE